MIHGIGPDRASGLPTQTYSEQIQQILTFIRKFSEILVDHHQHNDIIVLMVPAFNENGMLPPGIHQCSWDELLKTFSWTQRRLWLIAGLKLAATALKSADCKALYVDGSFVTRKDEPGDYDACWDSFGVDVAKLDPILLTFDAGRLAQKTKFRGELFVAHSVAEGKTGKRYMEFFQQDKDGNRKGLISIDLGSLP